MGGLALATFLTLLNVPALYVLLFRIKPPPSSDTTTPEPALAAKAG